MAPLSDCEVRDPRIRRTRKLLQQALTTLMRRQSFVDISVQDIAEEATVNRATFYDHYTDKFALLDALVGSGFHELLARREVRFQEGCPGALAAIILATCDYLTEAHSHGDCDQHSAFEPLRDAAIAKAIRRILLAGMKSAEEPTAQLIAATASASICAGVKQWLSSPDRPPAETFAEQLTSLILPMLEAAAPALERADRHEWSPSPVREAGGSGADPHSPDSYTEPHAATRSAAGENDR
jgi:AcrR family transcriptional regulator